MALPTIEEIFTNATACLDRAYRELGDARDWMRSDWRPVGAELRDDQAKAKRAVFEAITTAKRAINEAKDALGR